MAKGPGVDHQVLESRASPPRVQPRSSLSKSRTQSRSGMGKEVASQKSRLGHCRPFTDEEMPNLRQVFFRLAKVSRQWRACHAS